MPEWTNEIAVDFGVVKLTDSKRERYFIGTLLKDGKPITDEPEFTVQPEFTRKATPDVWEQGRSKRMPVSAMQHMLTGLKVDVDINEAIKKAKRNQKRRQVKKKK